MAGKKERKRYRNMWHRVMKRKYEGKWGEVLSQIPNPYTRIKVAGICFWDCYEEQDDYDWSENIKISRLYKTFFEDFYSIDELKDALIQIGYPKKLAERRSRIPKNG